MSMKNHKWGKLISRGNKISNVLRVDDIEGTRSIR